MFMKLLTLIFSLFLLSCSTPYQKSGFTGGFSEYQLDKDIFKVKFRGNAYTDLDTTKRYSLVRAAEITLENGGYFFIPSKIDKTLKEKDWLYDDGYSITWGSHTKPMTEIEFTIFRLDDLRNDDDKRYYSDEEIKEVLRVRKKDYPNKLYIAEDVLKYMKP